MTRPRTIPPESRRRRPNSIPDSFIPGKRVIEESRDRDGDGDALAVAAKAAGRVAGFGGRFRACFSSGRWSLHWHRLESRTVLFHGIMLGLLLAESGRALQPMEADASPASGVRGRRVLADHRMLHGRTIFPDAAGRSRKRPDPRAGGGEEQRALDAGDDCHLRDFHPQ